VATNAPAGWPVAFAAVATVTNNASSVAFNWNFGDGSAPVSTQFAQHAFAAPGIYAWRVSATVGTASATNTGNIVITAPVAMALSTPQNSSLSLTWPSGAPDVVVEQSATLGAAAQWTVVTNLPAAGPVNTSVSLPVAGSNRFYRLRQPW
jgi:PKD repeat protein